MGLKPLKKSRLLNYPKLGKGLLRGVVLAGAMGAATLGGCGPGVDSRSLDTVMNDVNGTVDSCNEDRGENCEEQQEQSQE